MQVVKINTKQKHSRGRLSELRSYTKKDSAWCNVTNIPFMETEETETAGQE